MRIFLYLKPVSMYDRLNSKICQVFKAWHIKFRVAGWVAEFLLQSINKLGSSLDCNNFGFLWAF